MNTARVLVIVTAALAAGCGAASVEPWVELASPAGAGSLAPRLDRGADDVLRLTWIEPVAGGGHALRFSAFDSEHGAWAAPREVAFGQDWFVNWADVPALTALADGTLLAAWLDRLGEGTYAYGVRVARSLDGGRTWSEPELLHEDDSPTEHGFVSLCALDEDTFAALWLDGRATGGGQHGHGGEMQLRARTLDREGRFGPERLLDERVCDCCPTALTRVGEGLLAAYRDRDAEELRDLVLVGFEVGGDPTPRKLPRDGWKIDGCPVNGPALAHRAGRVAAVWYTEAGGAPSVRAAFSRDGGQQFGEPLELAGAAAFGSLAADFAHDEALWVSWLEVEPDGLAGAWVLARVEPDAGTWDVRRRIAAPNGRAAGVARLVALGGGLLFAWVDADEAGVPRVRTARLASNP